MTKSNNRVYLLDVLRGIAVIGMVFHHSLVSYEIMFYERIDFLYTELFSAIQLVFVSVFLLISGICTNYSKNVMKRGLVVFGAALVVSFATCVVLPVIGIEGLNIYFGILHMFGLSMILYALLKRLFDKIPATVAIVLFAVLFFIYYAYYMTEPTSDSYFLMLFGVLPESITSYGDYYPLFPYFFMFICGTYIGKFIRAGKFPQWFYSFRFKPLECIGKYSLWIYILHQPVAFGIMYLLSM